MRAPQRRPKGNDRGAALLLAIGTVLMISSISAGLAAAASSSLQNRNTLELVRNREWAADSAIEKAVTQVRSLDCTSVSGMTQDATNGVSIRVDWTTDCSNGVPSSDGSNYLQRNVVFSACLDKLAQCQEADVIIRAQVNFEPRTGTVAKTFVQSWSVRL